MPERSTVWTSHTRCTVTEREICSSCPASSRMCEFNQKHRRYQHFLDRLASFARVIIFDKRGNGLSDRVPGAPSLEDRLDDVRAVLDAAGSTTAAVLGMSEGGRW